MGSFLQWQLQILHHWGRPFRIVWRWSLKNILVATVPLVTNFFLGWKTFWQLEQIWRHKVPNCWVGWHLFSQDLYGMYLLYKIVSNIQVVWTICHSVAGWKWGCLNGVSSWSTRKGQKRWGESLFFKAKKKNVLRQHSYLVLQNQKYTWSCRMLIRPPKINSQ